MVLIISELEDGSAFHWAYPCPFKGPTHRLSMRKCWSSSFPAITKHPIILAHPNNRYSHSIQAHKISTSVFTTSIQSSTQISKNTSSTTYRAMIMSSFPQPLAQRHGSISQITPSKPMIAFFPSLRIASKEDASSNKRLSTILTVWPPIHLSPLSFSPNPSTHSSILAKSKRFLPCFRTLVVWLVPLRRFSFWLNHTRIAPWRLR